MSVWLWLLPLLPPVALTLAALYAMFLDNFTTARVFNRAAGCLYLLLAGLYLTLLLFRIAEGQP